MSASAPPVTFSSPAPILSSARTNWAFSRSTDCDSRSISPIPCLPQEPRKTAATATSTTTDPRIISPSLAGASPGEHQCTLRRAARTRRLRRAGFLRLLGRWDGAKLLHHAELVEVVPTLHYLALGEAEDADASDLQRVACGRDAPELSAVGPAHRPAGDNLVVFGDLVFNLGV